MAKYPERLESSAEDFLAELTAAAYRVTLEYGLRGPFIDVELDLWRALRGVLRRRRPGADRPSETHSEEALPCGR
jgi:hypothetical protein